MQKKILIVDDSGTIRQQLTFILSRMDFTLVEAASGAEGLEKVTTDPDIKLIISDVKMPVMNGIEMVEAIRALGKYDHIPILFLTTEGSSEVMDKAKKLGIKGWLIKPFKSDILMNAVTQLTK